MFQGLSDCVLYGYYQWRIHSFRSHLLPTAAKRPIELYETLVLVASRRRQSELRSKKRPLTVQHFEISGGTTLVAHDGEADRLLQIFHDLFLANSHLMKFLICDQGIGHISEGVLNGLLVSDQSLLVLRFGQMQVPPKCTPCENGPTHLDAAGPNSGLGVHQAREKTTAPKCAASRAGERYLREERRFGDTNFGIRGNEHLLGFANIGPSFEQRGGQSRRHVRRKRLLGERVSARHALRVIANENADCIFLLANLPLEIRDLRICGVEHLLSLKHVYFCGDAAVKSERSQFDGIFLCVHRVSRDLEFQIKLQKHEVVARHIADEREHDGTLRILSSQELGARRFSLSSQLAEQVELERHVCRERQEI